MEGEFNVKGKNFLITGGHKGLGLETVRRLALGGGHIIIGCRDKKYFNSDAYKAKQDLCNEIKCCPDNINFMELDLSSISSVRKFCDKVLSSTDVLDVVICNAGVMSHKSNDNVTEDGLELHFSVHCLGHFLIFNLLKPLLLKSTDPRVIMVSSILLKGGQIDIDTIGSPDIERYKKFDSESSTPPGYADSKLVASLLVKELQEDDPSISFFSVSPGWCKTNLGRSAVIPWYKYPLLLALMFLFGKSVKEGADSIVFCSAAASSQLQQFRGKFIRGRQIERKIEQFLESHTNKSNLAHVS